MIVTLALALVIFLIGAFASGPVAVLIMLERSAAPAARAGSTVALDQTQALTDTQLEHLVLEVRGQYLDDRAESINWWLMASAIALAAITVFVTSLGILIVVAGFIGYRWFRDILDDARRYTNEAQRSAGQAQAVATDAQTTAKQAASLAQEAARSVERIEELRLQALNASAAIQQGYQAVSRYTYASTQPEVELARASTDEAPEVELARASTDEAIEQDALIAEAIRLQEQGDFRAAIEKWQAIARIMEGSGNDDAVRACVSVGYLAAENNELERAISAYDAAIQIDPRYALAYFDRGTAKGMLGRLDAAIVDFDEAISINPENVDAYMNRAKAKSELGRYEEALRDLEMATKFNPDDAETYFNRGNIGSDLGRYEDAIKEFDAAIQRNPQYTEAFNNRGTAKARLGRFADAIADLDTAINLDPGYRQAYTNRGNAISGLGRYDGAVEDYDEAIRIQADHPVAHANRGFALLNLGRRSEALVSFGTALGLARQVDDKELVARIERAMTGLDRAE